MGCQFIGLCSLSPEAQAAWAQAIFSVLGIAIAILVPAMQHRARSHEERERRRRRASIVRQLLSSNFETVLATANQLAGHYRTELGMRLERLPEVTLATVDELLHQGILYSFVSSWHEDELDLLDPDATQFTLQVIRKAEQYRTLHAAAQTGFDQERLRRFVASASSLVTLLDEIMSAASRANMIVRRDEENARSDRPR